MPFLIYPTDFASVSDCPPREVSEGRRPSDCIRIAGLCRAYGAVSASAETIPYIFLRPSAFADSKKCKTFAQKSGRSHFFDTL